MSKILHFADLHIGVENYGRTDPVTGLSTRLQDFLAALDELVDYALSHDIDLVLFAGDAYKSRDPSQTHQREFARRIMRLTAAGIPVFLLVGNHDLPYAVGRATALDIYHTLGVPLVTVGDRLGTYVIECRRSLRLSKGGGISPSSTRGVGIDTAHPELIESETLRVERLVEGRTDMADPIISPSPLRGDSEPTAYSSPLKGEGTKIQIVALPWVTRSHLLTLDEYKNLSADALNQVMERKIEELLEVEFSALDPSLPAVLAGHITLASARLGSERSMMVGRDPVIMKSALADARLDYVALGHVHRMQVFDGPTPAVYAGSLQRVDFGEEDQEKGFYVIDIDPAAPLGQRLRSYDFVPVHARAFVTIEVRSRSGNPTEDALRQIGRREKDIVDAIVRVQVNLPAGQEGLLDDAAVRRALASAHYIAGIARETEGGVRSRLGDVKVEGLTPIRALELYLKSKETPPERTKELLDYGRRVIQEASGTGELGL